MRLRNKVALITGGTSGIGEATAQLFSQEGARVAITGRNVERGQKVADRIKAASGRALFLECDVRFADHCRRAVDETLKAFGRLDVLFNNAGVYYPHTALDCTEEEWDLQLDINLKGAFLMSKYVIPKMLERGGGSIVITGSVQSVAAQRNSVHYVVSKHGLLGLTRCIALDFGKQNIRANCVLPGAIDTPMLRWAANLDNHPEKVLQACDAVHMRGKMGQPEEVAHVIVFLASDQASFMTASAVMVEGGLLVPVGGMAFQQSGTGATKA